MLFVASSAGCVRDRDEPLDRVRALLQEGQSDVARQVLLDKKLDLTPRGARLLVASFQDEHRFREAVAAMKERQLKFTKDERTTICVTAIDELSREEVPLPVDELFVTCEPMVDERRVDYETLKYTQKHEAGADAEVIRWFALADRLNETAPGVPADRTARLLMDFASQVIAATDDGARGEKIVAFLGHLDAVELRLALIEWQVGRLAELPEQQARSCIRMLERSSVALIEEHADLKAAFDEARSAHPEVADMPEVAGEPREDAADSGEEPDMDQQPDVAPQDDSTPTSIAVADASDADATNVAGLGGTDTSAAPVSENSDDCPLATFDQTLD